ncbi:hypothetical protein BGW36DRAFT_429367 [Talaromyces proteolyticus]|uniref:DUF1168 domain protein n=1 Tax=Talaromyces proteolyticus TaxID=1131652 RepID=A0AAD4PZB0_9EURO|nr:uncharacterized protein BGW36DRAFT_429367 [Talaromyces proteolyticus]KAH8695489.1 hypothetical protein BGW36DRAFT_429367 [Talaromyces proteolyticus]
MSEPGKESIPTSADPKSKRPTKRRQLTPVSEQANQISSLFKDPGKEIRLPSAPKPRTADSLAPPPEIVANVQGSSAGAGSGEFHVYKASRRREYERLRLMDEEVKREKDNEEFEKKKAEAQRKDDEKTEKNRRKREKRKAVAAKNKNGNKANGDTESMNVDNDQEAGPRKVPRLGPLPPRGKNVDAEVENDQELQVYEEQGVVIHDDD